MNKIKVGIVGCGFIGHKRAKALQNARLVACADISFDRAQELADQYPGCDAFNNWRDVIQRVDVVLIATTHDCLSEISLAAIKAGKDVLVEKPGARRAEELKPLIMAAEDNGVLVRVGFNHRYHRNLQKAFALIKEGALGELLFVRGRYGHGGRIGYDQEWRAKPEISGGGELIDQGIHLIDLAHCFLGKFDRMHGVVHTYFWNMPVEDNAFLTLETVKNQTAFLHVSCTEWKNLFSLEVYGKKGKLHAEGLGGSYGCEKLTYYKMLPQMGPPETTCWEFPMEDNSWNTEFAEFLEDIELRRQPNAGLVDAYAALKIVDCIYMESKYAYCTQPS